METVTVRNGIDVQALLDTIDAIKAKPAGEDLDRGLPVTGASGPAAGSGVRHGC